MDFEKIQVTGIFKRVEQIVFITYSFFEDNKYHLLCWYKFVCRLSFAQYLLITLLFENKH